jgi:hypothetical protein
MFLMILAGVAALPVPGQNATVNRPKSKLCRLRSQRLKRRSSDPKFGLTDTEPCHCAGLGAFGDAHVVNLPVVTAALDRINAGADILIGFGKIFDVIREAPTLEQKLAHRLMACAQGLKVATGQARHPHVSPN